MFSMLPLTVNPVFENNKCFSLPSIYTLPLNGLLNVTLAWNSLFYHEFDDFIVLIGKLLGKLANLLHKIID